MPKLAKIITKLPNQVVWCVAMELVNVQINGSVVKIQGIMERNFLGLHKNVKYSNFMSWVFLCGMKYMPCLN
jgi:hypothetical protein